MMALFLICMIGNGPQMDWEVSLSDLGVFIQYPDYVEYQQIAVADDGTVMLADNREKQLVFLDNEGKIKLRASRKGEGPGEFSGIGKFSWVQPADAFYVKVGSGVRVSKWNKNGAFQGEINIGRVISRPTFFDKNQVLFLKDWTGRRGTQPSLNLMDSKSGKDRELWKMPPLNEQSGYHKKRGKEERSWLMAWDPVPTYAVGAEFAVVNYSNSPEFEIIDVMTRKTSGKFKAKIPGVELSEESTEYFVDFFSSWGDELYTMVKNDATRPDYWPLVNKIFVDAKSRIWIGTNQREITGKAHVLILNRTGKEHHRFTINGNLQSVNNDSYYVVSSNDDEELSLTKFSLK